MSIQYFRSAFLFTMLQSVDCWQGHISFLFNVTACRFAELLFGTNIIKDIIFVTLKSHANIVTKTFNKLNCFFSSSSCHSP